MNGARSAPPAERIPRPTPPADDAGEPVPRSEPAADAGSAGTGGAVGTRRSGDSADAAPAARDGEEESRESRESREPAEAADEPAAAPAKDAPDAPAADGSDAADAAASADAADAEPTAAPDDPGTPARDREPAGAADQDAEPAAEVAAGASGKPDRDPGEKPSEKPDRKAAGEPPATPAAQPEGKSGKPEDEPEGKSGKPESKPEDGSADKPAPEPAGRPEGRGGAAKAPAAPADAAGGDRRPGGMVDRPTTALRVAGPRTTAPPPSAPPAPPAAPAGPPAPPMPSASPPPADADRDPMELLAALTNRPPPPPTPLRVVLRRIKIWTPLALLLLIIFVIAQSLRPLPDPHLEVTAAESFTFEGETPSVPWPETGQAALTVQGIGTFGTSGGSEPVPIASVAKVMTAYLALQEHPLEPGERGPDIPVDRQAAEESGLSESDSESTVEVHEGDTISEYEALQAILLPSANNVARLVARWVADSEEAFVERMNEAAEELGMEDTTYTDPSGLEPETVSTAADQVLLAEAAMADPVFREIVGVSGYEDSNGVTQANWNHLVPVDGVVGIKTGTTTAAGGCLMFAAEQEIGGERQLILGAVLGQPPHPSDNSILTGALTAGEELMDFAQDQLVTQRVFEAGDVVGEVDDGLGGTTPVRVTEDVTAVGWPGLRVRVALEEHYRDPEAEEGGATDSLPHSADADTRVGTLLVGDGDDGVSVPVALTRDLGEPGFGARLLRLG